MQPVITLFKTEALQYSELCGQLGILPGEAEECEFYYTYSPAPGQLHKALDIIKRNGVPHGIQFEPQTAPQTKKAPGTLRSELVQL
jgi:hypothetical protein